MSALGIIAVILFPAAGLGSIALIVHMLAAYSDKMVAALLFEPIPREVHHVARS